MPTTILSRPDHSDRRPAAERPRLRQDENGVWEYTEPDWEKLRAVVTGHGPASAERLAFRALSRAEVDWVSAVVLAEAA